MSADTSAVRAEEQLDLEALSSYLDRQGFARGRRIAVEQFPGGHSNLTYLLKLDGAGEYVLRRPPLGPVAPKAHDMVREFRILQAVHPVFPPAPEPALLCEDTAVLGAPFYLMERRRGLVVCHRGVAGRARLLPSLDPRLGRSLALPARHFDGGGRLGAGEVADAAMFLLSPRSRAVTGEILMVDAGFHVTGT